jgi:DNA/RNA-binding domain of Phe-tRNA-synthetase-like protein
MLLTVSENWKAAYPGAVVGAMLMTGVENPPEHAALDQLKTGFEQDVRRAYSAHTRPMLEQLPAIHPYVAYYSRFNKSYHVLFQLESVAQKGKNLPRVAALVEAMFMAELKNQLLTAGHDYNALRQPLKLDVATGTESYTLLNGKEQLLKVGDMYIADQAGILSSIIHGPDQRTPIVAATRQVIFTVYAPPGVGRERVEAHLNDIRDYVRVVSPQANVAVLEIYAA